MHNTKIITHHSALFFPSKRTSTVKASKKKKKQCTVTALPINKSYKSHCKAFENNTNLLWLFLLFGRLIFICYFVGYR
jgi:hypothetical protein